MPDLFSKLQYQISMYMWDTTFYCPSGNSSQSYPKWISSSSVWSLLFPLSSPFLFLDIILPFNTHHGHKRHFSLLLAPGYNKLPTALWTYVITADPPLKCIQTITSVIQALSFHILTTAFSNLPIIYLLKLKLFSIPLFKTICEKK